MYNRAARARAMGQAAAGPGPFSKPGGGDAQLSLSQTSAAHDFYFPAVSQQGNGGGGNGGRSSKHPSPVKHAAAGDLVMGGLLAGPGMAVPPELMDETSRPPDTSAATTRAIFTPVVMNQHGEQHNTARLSSTSIPRPLRSTIPSIQMFSRTNPSTGYPTGGSNWGGIQVRVKKSTANRSHDSAALAALSNALPMNEGASVCACSSVAHLPEFC